MFKVDLISMILRLAFSGQTFRFRHVKTLHTLPPTAMSVYCQSCLIYPYILINDNGHPPPTHIHALRPLPSIPISSYFFFLSSCIGIYDHPLRPLCARICFMFLSSRLFIRSSSVYVDATSSYIISAVFCLSPCVSLPRDSELDQTLD